MTREEAITELIEAGKVGKVGRFDPECAHGDADEVLCELLCFLGYGDVVHEWRKVEREY